MLDTFLPVYAALRLSGPPKKTVTGLALQGCLLLILAPFVVLGLLLTALLRLVQAEHRHRPTQTPPFDYGQWQLDAAKRKLARNQDAYRRRQANKPTGFEGSIADLDQMMKENR